MTLNIVCFINTKWMLSLNTDDPTTISQTYYNYFIKAHGILKVRRHAIYKDNIIKYIKCHYWRLTLQHWRQKSCFDPASVLNITCYQGYQLCKFSKCWRWWVQSPIYSTSRNGNKCVSGPLLFHSKVERSYLGTPTSRWHPPPQLIKSIQPVSRLQLW